MRKNRLGPSRSRPSRRHEVDAAHANDSKLEDLTQDFIAAYWGTMVLVEDHDVEKAMIEFSVAMADFKEGWIGERILKDRADVLIKACRQLPRDYLCSV